MHRLLLISFVFLLELNSIVLTFPLVRFSRFLFRIQNMPSPFADIQTGFSNFQTGFSKPSSSSKPFTSQPVHGTTVQVMHTTLALSSSTSRSFFPISFFKPYLAVSCSNPLLELSSQFLLYFTSKGIPAIRTVLDIDCTWRLQWECRSNSEFCLCLS